MSLGSPDLTSLRILYSPLCCEESRVVHRIPDSSAFFKEANDKNGFKEETGTLQTRRKKTINVFGGVFCGL